MKNQKSKIKNQKFNLKFKTAKAFAFLLAILTFNFCLFTLYLPKANAETISLKISPSLVQIQTEEIPYESSTPLTIENLADKGVNLRHQIKLFKAGDKGNGQVEYLDDQNLNQNFLENIQITDERGAISELTLGPKQKKTVQLKISLPANQTPSDYYFSVIFVSKPYIQPQMTQPTTQNSFSTISEGVAMNTLLSIGPRESENITIEEFSPPSFVQRSPVPFAIRVKNNGTQYVRPTGNILIKNMFGQTIGKIYLPAQNILSSSSRYLVDSSVYSESTPDTQKEAVRRPDDQKAHWPEKFLLGPYTAELTLELSDGQTLTKQTKFFAFPIKLFLILALSTLALLIIYKRTKAKMRER